MNKFNWPYKVPISDINYGGHMGNDKSLALFHEARIAFLNHLGFSELNIGNGVGIIMKYAHVDYLAEVFHGDDLEVEVALGKQEGLLFEIDYKVTRKVDQKLVLAGQTGILPFNYEQRKVARIPQEFLDQIKKEYEN